MALQTVLTKRLGLRYPVIAAPLGRGSTPPNFLLLWLAKVQWGLLPLCICRSLKYDKRFQPMSRWPAQVIALASI